MNLFLFKNKRFILNESIFHIPAFEKLANFDFTHPAKKYDEKAIGYRAIFYLPYLHDPSSPFANLEINKRKTEAKNAAFLQVKEKEIEKVLASKEFKEAEAVYKKLCLSHSKRLLNTLKKTVDKVIESLEAKLEIDSIENLKEIREFAKEAPNLIDQIAKLEEKVKAENDLEEIHGGHKLSFLEQLLDDPDSINSTPMRYE